MQKLLFIESYQILQCSGAYIFRPTGSPSVVSRSVSGLCPILTIGVFIQLSEWSMLYSTFPWLEITNHYRYLIFCNFFLLLACCLQVPLKIIRGPLLDEVHQQFNSWIYQVQYFIFFFSSLFQSSLYFKRD